MVKIFFAGLLGFVLLAVGLVSYFATPIIGGVHQNLGTDNPTIPFHPPIPQPIVDAVQSVFGSATPTVLLYGTIGLAILLLAYTGGTLFGSLAHRRRERTAELRFRGRAGVMRDQGSVSKKVRKNADLDKLFK